MFAPEQLQKIFDLYKTTEQALGITDFSSRLIHYTTQEKFEKILSSNSMWFGRLSDMNDTTEVDHFLDGLMVHAPGMFPEFPADTVRGLLNQFRPVLRNQTYISSWCEYVESDPDGVLSMWERYGTRPQGVGLVIDSSPFIPSALVPKNLTFFLNVTRIEYVKEGEALAVANRLVRAISQLPYLQLMERLSLVILLLAKAPCVKHHSFAEEREIRFLTTSALTQISNSFVQTGRIFPELEKRSIGPREFVSVPLQLYPASAIDLRIGSLLSKIIVRPGPDANERVSGVKRVLGKYGLDHVPVVASAIPLRA